MNPEAYNEMVALILNIANRGLDASWHHLIAKGIRDKYELDKWHWKPQDVK